MLISGFLRNTGGGEVYQWIKLVGNEHSGGENE